MYILIAGGGKIGEFLAQTLKRGKNTIAVIEKDESVAQKLAENVSDILVIVGDACDPNRLKDAGIERTKILVATTGDDEDNLIISQLAKDSFGVPHVIARINNPKNEPIFNALGIEAISSTTIIAKLIEEEASVGDITTLLALKKGNLAIIEAVLSPSSPVINKEVKDLNLPPDCILASVLRGEEVIFPRGNTILKSNDSVIALVSSHKEKELKKALLG